MTAREKTALKDTLTKSYNNFRQELLKARTAGELERYYGTCEGIHVSMAAAKVTTPTEHKTMSDDLRKIYNYKKESME